MGNEDVAMQFYVPTCNGMLERVPLSELAYVSVFLEH